jgi:hypothetical protein
MGIDVRTPRRRETEEYLAVSSQLAGYWVRFYSRLTLRVSLHW